MAGRFERRASAHCQDIAENVADFSHLEGIHTSSFLLTGEDYVQGRSSGWRGRWIQHSYIPKWSKSGVTSLVELEIKSRLLGRELLFLNVKGHVWTTGPAFFHTSYSVGFWRFYSCMSVTPTGPFAVDLVHYVFTEPSFPWILNHIINYAVMNMVS